MNSRNFYQVLKVAENASFAEIKLSYNKMIQDNHSVSFATSGNHSIIEKAYATLICPIQRAIYDYENFDTFEPIKIEGIEPTLLHLPNLTLNPENTSEYDLVCGHKFNFTSYILNSKLIDFDIVELVKRNLFLIASCLQDIHISRRISVRAKAQLIIYFYNLSENTATTSDYNQQLNIKLLISELYSRSSSKSVLYDAALNGAGFAIFLLENIDSPLIKAQCMELALAHESVALWYLQQDKLNRNISAAELAELIKMHGESIINIIDKTEVIAKKYYANNFMKEYMNSDHKTRINVSLQRLEHVIQNIGFDLDVWINALEANDERLAMLLCKNYAISKSDLSSRQASNNRLSQPLISALFDETLMKFGKKFPTAAEYLIESDLPKDRKLTMALEHKSLAKKILQKQLTFYHSLDQHDLLCLIKVNHTVITELCKNKTFPKRLLTGGILFQDIFQLQDRNDKDYLHIIFEKYPECQARYQAFKSIYKLKSKIPPSQFIEKLRISGIDHHIINLITNSKELVLELINFIDVKQFTEHKNSILKICRSCNEALNILLEKPLLLKAMDATDFKEVITPLNYKKSIDKINQWSLAGFIKKKTYTEIEEIIATPPHTFSTSESNTSFSASTTRSESLTLTSSNDTLTADCSSDFMDLLPQNQQSIYDYCDLSIECVNEVMQSSKYYSLLSGRQLYKLVQKYGVELYANLNSNSSLIERLNDYILLRRFCFEKDIYFTDETSSQLIHKSNLEFMSGEVFEFDLEHKNTQNNKKLMLSKYYQALSQNHHLALNKILHCFTNIIKPNEVNTYLDEYNSLIQIIFLLPAKRINSILPTIMTILEKHKLPNKDYFLSIYSNILTTLRPNSRLIKRAQQLLEYFAKSNHAGCINQLMSEANSHKQLKSLQRIFKRNSAMAKLIDILAYDVTTFGYKKSIHDIALLFPEHNKTNLALDTLLSEGNIFAFKIRSKSINDKALFLTNLKNLILNFINGNQIPNWLKNQSRQFSKHNQLKPIYKWLYKAAELFIVNSDDLQTAREILTYLLENKIQNLPIQLYRALAFNSGELADLKLLTRAYLIRIEHDQPNHHIAYQKHIKALAEILLDNFQTNIPENITIINKFISNILIQNLNNSAATSVYQALKKLLTTHKNPQAQKKICKLIFALQNQFSHLNLTENIKNIRDWQQTRNLIFNIIAENLISTNSFSRDIFLRISNSIIEIDDSKHCPDQLKKVACLNIIVQNLPDLRLFNLELYKNIIKLLEPHLLLVLNPTTRQRLQLHDDIITELYRQLYIFHDIREKEFNEKMSLFYFSYPIAAEAKKPDSPRLLTMSQDQGLEESELLIGQSKHIETYFTNIYAKANLLLATDEPHAQRKAILTLLYLDFVRGKNTAEIINSIKHPIEKYGFFEHRNPLSKIFNFSVPETKKCLDQIRTKLEIDATEPDGKMVYSS